MGKKYLLDTNAITDYLFDSFESNGTKFLDQVVDSKPVISFITQIELLSWKTEFQTEKLIKDFISISKIIYISDEIIDNAVIIRRSKKIKLPDAIIASTALTLDYTIITNNTKDFDNIESLKILNPYSL